MQGVALRAELRTNVPGHTSVVGGVVYNGSGVPAVASGTRFTVGRGVLSVTLGSSPVITGGVSGTYTNVPMATSTGSDGFCSLTLTSTAVTAVSVTAPGTNYTAAGTFNVAVGSLFWTGAVLAAGSGLTNGTYLVPILNTSGQGMIASVVVAGAVISTVTVNPATATGTAVGSNYGTSAITYSLPADALYAGSPAIASSFSLTPNPVITGGTLTTVITGNCSIVFAGKVKSVVSAVASPDAAVGATAFSCVKRYAGTTYVNFGTFKNVTTGTPNTADLTWSSATPSSGDGFDFHLVTTDSEVTL